jgi:hypothetical protein
MASRGRYPDFFIIGAAKAGSTALWQALRHHPSLYFPAQKEPNFFAYKGGADTFTCPSAVALRANWTTDLEAYLSSFAESPTDAKAGEASVSYLALPSTANEIAAAVPDARLIAVLRDPVDRAFSHFQFYRQMEWETFSDFEDALVAAPKRIAAGWRHTYDYLAAGLYGRQLDHWLRIFPGDQLLTIFHEDWVQQPQETLAKVCRHLDVTPCVLPITRENNTTLVRSRELKLLIDSNNKVRSYARMMLPRSTRSDLGRLLRTINSAPKPVLGSSTRSRLVTYFRDDIRLLESLTGRELSSWLA